MKPCAQPLRIGWIGFHMEGVPALRAVLQSGVRLEGVITLADENRQKRSAAMDYAGIVAGSDVPLYQVASINDPGAVSLLRGMGLDLCFVIGWSQILGPEALGSARLGMIGSHASLLPHNRGSAPVNWAILNGEERGGNTLMWLSGGVDEGDIIDQLEFPITPYDTCATVYEKVAETNRVLIMGALSRILEGERPGRRQPPTDEPILPRRRPADGEIDWAQPARKVYDFVRGLTRPYPGAFSSLDGTRWSIWSCAVLPGPESRGSPGEVVGPVYSPSDAACGQMVACGEGAVVLLEVEGANGEILRGASLSERPWKGKVWARG